MLTTFAALKIPKTADITSGLESMTPHVSNRIPIMPRIHSVAQRWGFTSFFGLGAP